MTSARSRRAALVLVLGTACPAPDGASGADASPPAPSRPAAAEPEAATALPGPPEGAQLDETALETTLAEASQQLQDRQPEAATETLAPCANKVPASPRCDTLMGLALYGQRSVPLRPRAGHFLDQGLRVDDPKADVDWYRRVGTEARRFGRHDAGAVAFRYALARPGEHLLDWVALSQALQSDDGRVREAIEALDEALKLAPERADLWWDKGTLLAQTSRTAEAVGALERYLELAPADDDMLDSTRARLPDLRARVQADAETGPAEAP
jgi:tetratricopeptide (TPR) repeat protein